MIQYTQTQVLRLRERAARDDSIYTILDEHIQPVLEHYRIPTAGIATWEGFYACPKHSVFLTFDISDANYYRCPVDGEVFTGAPYEGAWWRLLNDANEKACRMAACRYLLFSDAGDLDLSRRILTDYAAHYPGYAVHGGIPYNNPGKANAQSLCDASWIKGLAIGYDIIREALTNEEQTFIEQNLFRACADFLIGQRVNQLHNHECIVSSAVGVIGLLLGENRYIDFAVNTVYGLKYQLEHAVLKDGLWFEGTPHYHFYAMQQFIEYERFAANASYSFFHDPQFVEILKFPLRLIQPDSMLPLLNDAGSGNHGFIGTENLYEIAYARTGDPDFVRLLHQAYKNRPRRNIHAFFDGVEMLPTVEPSPLADYHAGEVGASGLTTMHGPQGRFLLVKHAPFGGEHDHYDRLGLHFMGFGHCIAPDIGTCKYGAPLHYAYYKNTMTHNTVCLNGQNQPPADCRVLAYDQREGVTALDTEVKWDGGYQMLDSFTIPQWSDEAYTGAAMRRHITWYGDFFVDCFEVTTPEERDIDWMLHIRGRRESTVPIDQHAGQWAREGAGRYLHDVEIVTSREAVIRTTWAVSEGVQVDVFSRMQDVSCFYALGPDNPSVDNLSYLIQRKRGTEARFMNVICASDTRQPVLRCVEEDGQGLVIVRAGGDRVTYAYPYRTDREKR